MTDPARPADPAHGPDPKRGPDPTRGRARAAASPASLKALIGWLVAAIVIPCLALAGWLIHDAGLRAKAEALAGVQATVRALAGALDRDHAARIALLKGLAASAALAADDLATFHAEAMRVVAGSEDNLVLARPDGARLLTTIDPFGTPLRPTRNMDLLQRILAAGGPVISDLFVSTGTGRPAFTTALPVRRDGQIRYILLHAGFASALNAIFEAQKMPPDWIGTIEDGQGVVAARTHDPGAFVGRPARRHGPEPEGLTRGPTPEGVPSYNVYSTASLSGWRVAITVPAAQIDAVQRRTILSYAAIAGLAALAAIAAAWWGTAVVVRRPTAAILAAVERWEAGDHGARVDTHGQPRELARIGATCNRLAETADQLLQQKDFLMRELQHRVMNSLQLLSSMIGLQARGLRDPEARAQFAAAQQRIGAMSRIYRRLYALGSQEQVDFASFLKDFCAETGQAYLGPRPAAGLRSERDRIARHERGHAHDRQPEGHVAHRARGARHALRHRSAANPPPPPAPGMPETSRGARMRITTGADDWPEPAR